MFSAIAFDFDGVILESVDIKTHAFAALFDSFPDHNDEILAYHLNNLGVSRYVKFNYIYENILHRPLSESAKDKLDRQFSELISVKIRDCPFVPGIMDFLKKRVHEFPLFVVSATPQPELVSIVRDRNLLHFFRGIYGTPPPKSS